MLIQVVIFAVIGAASICLDLLLAGRSSFARQLRSELSDLRQDAPNSPDLETLTSRIANLPDPVRRYMLKALPKHLPIARTARIRHTGRMLLKPGANWIQVRGDQWFTIWEPGFQWRATGRMGPLSVVVRDLLQRGFGMMSVRLFGAFKLVDAASPEIDSAATVRWIAEVSWFPIGLVGDAIRWESVDDRTARACVRCAGREEEAVFRFGEDDMPQTIEACRYRTVDGKAIRTPWLGEYHKFEHQEDMLIPMAIDVTWKLPTGDFHCIHFDIESLEFVD